MTDQSAVLLVNLGSPVAPTPVAVKQFLNRFLSDQRVVELPALLWRPLLRGIILPLRSKRVAKLYHDIWTEQGSPLTAITKQQAEKLQQHFVAQDRNVSVAYAMSYSDPSIANALTEFRRNGIERVVVLPLYPQYSGTTTGAIFDQLAAFNRNQRYVMDLRVVREYCLRADYVDVLAQSIQSFREKNGSSELLLFSYHGIPQACVDKGDPYYQQCLLTSERVAQKLGLKPEQWRMTFQSRFGKAQWLQPYTDAVLTALPAENITSVDVVCPAFAADCLETLEEIETGSREIFMAAGGKKFARIPCLNASEEHIQLLAKIVENELK